MGLTVRELCPKEDQGQWFALAVKYQHERRVESVLCAAGMDTFLPLYRLRRQWSDRAKDLEAPLFPGYVFGRFPLHERARIVNTPGVSRIVGFAGLPAPVAEQEIEGV